MKQTGLLEIRTGEMPFATGASEPARGSSTAGMETRAKRYDGEYFVSVSVLTTILKLSVTST